MTWWERTAWYHLYPLGFVEAPRDNPAPGRPGADVDHRLGELHPWLEHAAGFGADGVLLGPVFESSSHGYDTVDPFRVDRRLGTERDLVDLVDACHDRGQRVLLDGVFNHVGREHPAFREVRERGRGASTADWFHLDFDAEGVDGFSYADFEGHGELVALNHRNPAVVDWAVDVATYWLDRGVDGWRLDAAYQVPVEFWAAFTDRVKRQHPDTFLVGEVIHGDYARFVAQGGLDSVTQYELWKAIWSSLNDANFFELAHALERHASVCEHMTPWTFLGNHDTTRIATQLDDERHLAHALVLLFTLPGIPAVYAGDEHGARGTKRDAEGGDDDIRRPPPGSPGRDPTGWLLDLYRQLIGLRGEHPWLARADLEVEHLENERILIAPTGPDERLHIALNVGGDPFEVPLPDAAHPVAGVAASKVPGHGWGIWQERR